MLRSRISKILFSIMILGPLYLCTGFGAGKNKIENQLSAQKNELEEIKKNLQQGKKSLDSLVKRKSNYVHEVEQIHQNLNLSQRFIKTMDSIGNTLERSLDHLKGGLREIEKSIRYNDSLIALRVRALYMKGKKDWLSTVLDPSSDLNFVQQIYFARKITDYDKSLIEKAKGDLVRKKKQQRFLSIRIVENKNFKAKKTRQVSKMNSDIGYLKRNISSLEKNEERKRKALKEMEKNSKAIQALILKLEEQRKRLALKPKKPKTLPKKGKYCFPTVGKLVSRYGVHYHATLKTKTKNLGVEYLGKSGEPVVSAVPGEVVYVNDIPGHGRGVIIYNSSDYYTIYGNLSQIKVKEGDLISGCQEIATIPKSRSKLKRKVYFEVRKSRESIDPVKWLRKMIH